MVKKNEQLDPEEIELIEWCIEVEGFLVAVGASEQEAQAYIEEEAEWFTDLFFEGYTPEQAAQEELQVLWREHTVLKSTHEQRESHYQEQLALLSQARSSLTQEFENLAHKTFEEKGKNFVQHNQMGLEQLLKPFREQIKGFQKRVNEVHDAAQRGQASLYTEIKNIMDIGLKMSAEANNLTQALKGDSQQRGAWGEAQLRRTLEMSGCNDPLISCSGIITKEKYDEYRDDRRNQTLDS